MSRPLAWGLVILALLVVLVTVAQGDPLATCLEHSPQSFDTCASTLK